MGTKQGWITRRKNGNAAPWSKGLKVTNECHDLKDYARNIGRIKIEVSA